MTADTATRSDVDSLTALNRDYIHSVQHGDVQRFDEVDVGLLGCWREVANRHVVDHPSTQRRYLSYHGNSCLMIGSGQPQSSQTGASLNQPHSPPAQAGSLCAGHAQ